MKKLKPYLKIFVSLLLFATVVSNVDKTALYANIKLLDLRFVPLIVGLLILNYVVSSIRWKNLLIFEVSKLVSLPFLIALYFKGAFFNNFMPTSMGGDVFKILKLGQKIKSKTHAFTATVMERFTGFVVLVLISYVGLLKTWQLLLGLLPPSVVGNKTLLLFFQFLGVFGFWIALAGAFFTLKLLAGRSENIKNIYESFTSYSKRVRVLVWAFVTSFAVQLFAIFTQYFIFTALGIKLPLFYALFVFPVITLASFFVPSINGVGIQDLLYVQLFQTVGIGAEVALSASIIYHLFRLGVSLIGGVLYAFEKDIA